MFITKKKLQDKIDDAVFEAEEKVYERQSLEKWKDRVCDLEEKVSALEEKIERLKGAEK